MMNKKKQIGMAILAVLMTASVTAWAANDPLTISADTLSYDGNTGRADATGNVVITQADKTMTGANGWYNTKTQEASLEGGVSLIGSDMAMSAQSVHSYNNNKFTASGGVHLQRGDRQIFGESVEYSTDSEYVVLLSGSAHAVQNGNVLNAPELRIRLADDSAETLGGRSTLIIVPNK